MAKTFQLEIVTPERLFYWGAVEIVIVQTLSGEEGFMAGHIWASKLLGIGELWFREAGAKEFRVAAVSGGFVDVRGNVLVFTDSAEWPDEIDVGRASLAVTREREWLDGHGLTDNTPEEIAEHKEAARRAENRQKVAGGGGHPWR